MLYISYSEYAVVKSSGDHSEARGHFSDAPFGFGAGRDQYRSGGF